MIPAHLREGLERYRDHRIATGSFLRSILCNNLYEAVLRADDISARELGSVTRWIFTELPNESWGNAAKVDAWLRDGPK